MPTADLPDAQSYAAARDRILALVEGLSADQSARPVAACPGWTVHDVVSHLTGIADDVVAGRLEGLGSATWTAAQVDARRHLSTTAVCAEWRAVAPAFDALLAAQPPIALAAAADAVVHELDVCEAVGAPVERSSVAVREATRRYAELSAARVRDAGLGPIVVESTEGDRFDASEAEPVSSASRGDEPASSPLTVRAAAYDLLRTFTGRRSHAEARSLDWSGDADAAIPHLSPYGALPAEPVAV